MTIKKNWNSSRQMSRAILYATSALCTMTPAFAQQSPGTSIEEVIVTAQKRGESIQDVPAAVSAVSGQTLEDMHSTQLTDIGSYVPALQINSGGTPGQTTISIRGIAPVGAGATVATYIDDSPIGSSSAHGGAIAFALDLLPYDVERMEVLRGPQGTLYGASSMGGLLKYVLTTPSLNEFEGRVGGDISSVSEGGKPGGGGRATLSGPIIPGTLALTASVGSENTPGFIDNSVTGQSGQNGVLQQSGRLGLYWKPSEDLSVKANVLYQRIDADGDANVALDPTTLQPLAGNHSDNNLTDQPFEKRIAYYSLAVEYNLPWAQFVSATSYSDSKTSQTQDASYTYGVAFPYFGLPVGASQYHYRLHLDKATEEARLQSLPDTSLEWTAGFFWTQENSSNFQSPSALTLGGVPIPGLDPLFAGNLPSTYTEYAGFGDLTYHLTDVFEIFGGVRYAENRQTFSEIGGGSIISPIALLDQRSQESVATYSTGLRYHVADGVMTYARVASGYQPGGPNIAAPGIPPTFGSDSLTNYEVGVKSELLDKRVLFDLDAFYIDWQKIQLITNGAGFSYGVNGGSAKSQGIEMNTTIKPLNGLTIDGTFSYIDAALTQDAPPIGGLSGDLLPDIPRLSGSVRVSYSRDLADGWIGTIGTGLRAQGKRVSDVNHAFDSRPMPGYAALDLNADISNDAWTVRLFAKNVTDTRAYLTYQPLINQATGAISQIEAALLQPRTVGLSFDRRF